MINPKIVNGLDDLIETLCLLGYDDLQKSAQSIKAIYLKDNAPRTKKTTAKKEKIYLEITQGDSTNIVLFNSSKLLEAHLKKLRKIHDGQIDSYCKEHNIWKPICIRGEQAKAKYAEDVKKFTDIMTKAKLNLSIKIHQDYDAI